MLTVEARKARGWSIRRPCGSGPSRRSA